MEGKDTFKKSVIGMQQALYAFAFKLTLDEDEAQDLVQDTTLKALNNQEKFDEGSNLSCWMHTIMRNTFLNNCRKRMIETTPYDVAEELYTLTMVDIHNVPTPEGVYEAREINEVFEELSPEIRKPLSMYIAGYKYEEISERLNIPIGTVKSKIFMARKMLSELLKDYR